MKVKRGKRGISLAKVIVVAAVVAVLVGLFVPVYTNYTSLRASRENVITVIEP